MLFYLGNSQKITTLSFTCSGEAMPPVTIQRHATLGALPDKKRPIAERNRSELSASTPLSERLTLNCHVLGSLKTQGERQLFCHFHLVSCAFIRFLNRHHLQTRHHQSQRRRQSRHPLQTRPHLHYPHLLQSQLHRQNRVRLQP